MHLSWGTGAFATSHAGTRNWLVAEISTRRVRRTWTHASCIVLLCRKVRMSVLLCLVVMRELDEGMQHIDLYDCVRVPCVCV